MYFINVQKERENKNMENLINLKDIVLYQNDNGNNKIEVLYENENFWLT